MRKRQRGNGEAGFTLLEVLIAFAVLALMLVPILQIFGSGMGSSRTARGYAMATLLARSKLAELSAGATFVEGETSGTFEGAEGYRWQTTIARDTSPIVLPPETIAQVDDPSAKSNRRGAQSPSRGNATSDLGNRSSGGSREQGTGFGQSLGGSKGRGFGSGSGSGSGTEGGFGSSRSGIGSEQQSSGFGTASRSPGEIGDGDGETGATSEDLLAYKVTVTVNWGPANGTEVTLSTLRIGRQPEAGTSLQ